MKSFLKRISFLIALFLFSFSFEASAQVRDSNVYVYDVVYMKDGRVLKGEILIFEEKDGDITFRDLKGNKYSITRKEYNYFVEDKRYVVKSNDTLAIRKRKENEIEFSLGFSGITTRTSFNFDGSEDTYFYNPVDNSYLNSALCFRIGIGKYFTREHFIGLVSNFGVISESNSYFDVGLRYANSYDGYKKNVSFFTPVGIQFSYSAFKSDYRVYGPDPYQIGFFAYPMKSIDSKVSAVGVSLGQGMSFILENKKSFTMEIMLMKDIFVTQKVSSSQGNTPKVDYSSLGGKFSIFYNF